MDTTRAHNEQAVNTRQPERSFVFTDPWLSPLMRTRGFQILYWGFHGTAVIGLTEFGLQSGPAVTVSFQSGRYLHAVSGGECTPNHFLVRETGQKKPGRLPPDGQTYACRLSEICRVPLYFTISSTCRLQWRSPLGHYWLGRNPVSTTPGSDLPFRTILLPLSALSTCRLPMAIAA